MSEIEELEGGYRRRRRPAPDTTPDVVGEQEQGQDEGRETATLTEVASDLHGTYGNQLVGAALSGTASEGLEGAMAAQLGAAVGGLGSWAQEGADSNQAMCRAMRHASGASEEQLEAPRNLGHGGSMLPEQVRIRMEAAMGHDFSHVRIHTEGAAQTASKDINAHAFTAGSHIYFGSGEFQPGTQKGDRLIAHELTHVIQHDEHRLKLPSTDRAVSLPTDPTEVEAYANEKRVLSELQTVDAALQEGIGDVEIDPVRTTGEIVGAVSEGAQAQTQAVPSPSVGDTASRASMLDSVVDAVMDAANMREDEERLDAEEELEVFMSQTFDIEHFHPSTGRGNIDGEYDASRGILKVRVGVFFNFLDGDPSVNPAWIAWQKRHPKRWYPTPAFEWTEEEKSAYATNAIGDVVQVWEGQYTFHNTRPHWEALPDVNVEIVIDQVDKATAHYAIDVIKWPLDVGGAHVDIPGAASTHSHGSSDPDHVGAEFHESSGDGDVGDPDESHFVRTPTTRAAYNDADTLNPDFVHFSDDSAVVSATDRADLKRFGAALGRPEMPVFPVEVEGHSDTRGPQYYNQGLSEDRADAVKVAIEAGGPKQSPTAIGRGEAAADDTEWSRRADIYLEDFESEQTTVVHEFGHIFGLGDEYPRQDGAGSRQVGDEVAHSAIAQELIAGQQPVVAHHSESVMSNGEDVQPCHYVTFLEMLGTMTDTMGQWAMGPGPGPGVGAPSGGGVGRGVGGGGGGSH